MANLSIKLTEGTIEIKGTLVFVNHVATILNEAGLSEDSEASLPYTNGGKKSEISDNDVFYIKGRRQANAIGKVYGKGFMVLKGALMAKEETAATPESALSLRKRLINDAILVLNNGRYELKEDYIFPSASAAACQVIFSSVSGNREWKNKAGYSLGEVLNK